MRRDSSLRTPTRRSWLTILTMVFALPAWADELVEPIVRDRASGQSAAVRVRGRALAHTTQLLPLRADGQPLLSAERQIEAVLNQLKQTLDMHGSTPDQLVKINVYVASSAIRQQFLKRWKNWALPGQALPAKTMIATALPHQANVALDAVFAIPAEPTKVMRQAARSGQGKARRAITAVLPRGDVVYVSGQAEPGDLKTATRKTLQSLLKTLKHLHLGRDDVVQFKCFVTPIKEVATVNREIAALFPDGISPPVSYVEWISGSRPIEIEAIAFARRRQSPDGLSVSHFTPPWMRSSAVFSRVSRIHGDGRLYIAGLSANKKGDAKTQTAAVFRSLSKIVHAGGADMRHLAKATYYVADGDASQALNKIRPSVYDPVRPPSASKALVRHTGIDGRSLVMDMIAAPIAAKRNKPGTVAVRKKIVKDTSTGDFRTARKMITGPGTNQHPPYPGCTGFIGWESVTRLSNGDLLCSFSAGYWHVSFPSPVDVKPGLLRSYQNAGFPKKVNAPTGGRALVCRSKDQGKTWTRPTTLVDTPGDDRHPVIVELPDKSLLCAFFVIDNWYGYAKPPAGRNKNSRVATIRSTDGGKTWSKPVYMPSPFKYYDRMCGKPVVMPNGDVLMPTYGMDEWTKPVDFGVYRSRDGGRSWRFHARLKASVKELDEPALCRNRKGELIMIARPDGEIAFSADRGKNWTKPRPFGIKMVAPCLLTLKDGTIVCIFGYGATGGLQMMWSDDDGKTWTVPQADRGFRLDNSVYVYGIGEELPDGSIYIVYYDPRGKQRQTAIWGLRVKIRPDRRGIDVLPIQSK